MTYTEADLDMAERHIAQAEEHVIKQERIVGQLRAHGHSTEMADLLLEEFTQTLQQHREHRDRIAEELRAAGRRR